MDKGTRLRDDLNDRLLRFRRGDRAAVVGPAAQRMADELRRWGMGTTAEGRPTMSIVDAYLLGHFHWCRYQVLPPSGQPAEIERIREYFNSLLEVAPEYVPDDVCELLSDDPQQRARAKIMVVGPRAAEQVNRAHETKDVAELDVAIELMRTLPLRDLPSDVAIRFYISLSWAWRDRYDWAGDPADLERAIAWCQVAMATGHPGVSADFDYRGELDQLLTRRYERTGRAEHLDEVVTERAARLAAAVGADRSHWRMRLASSLGDRFARRGDPADLREAVRQCRAAVDETADGERGRALTLLFKIQSDGYIADDALADLSDIIAAGTEALTLLPEDGDLVPKLRTNLGVFQLRCYKASGDSGDLVSALELLEKAVEALPVGDDGCITARARLADALVMRHQQAVRQGAALGFGAAVTRSTRHWPRSC